MNKSKLFFSLIGTALLQCCGIASAADEIYIPKTSGIGNEPPIWVSLSGFSGEAEQVLRFDLYVQGFNFTNAESAQYIITGSNNGNLQGRVTDRFNKSALLSKAYSGSNLRRQAHAFADDFVEALQRKPIAQTKIALKVGTGGNSEIYVADFDGKNGQPVTRDNTIVSAPCWVPGKFALFYSSYKLGNPAIFSHNLSTGTRKTVAWYGGSSISPAVSVNGKVAMILSKDGWTDLYVADADGTNLKRLTKSREDESSPCWSPDGQWICYATRIKERRVLCKIAASGGTPQTIRTVGAPSPTEPDWSPDGKWIAFTSQMGDFQICVVKADGSGEATVLVPGEDPSWAPNSRTLIFSRRSGGEHLSLLDVPTKQTKDVARVSSGNNSQPSWAR